MNATRAEGAMDPFFSGAQIFCCGGSITGPG